MSNEAVDLLRHIAATLSRIEILLAKTPKSRRPKTNTGSRYAKMIAEQRELTLDQTPITRTLELWAEVCPDCEPPVTMDLDRRILLRGFWDRFQGEDGVRSVFEVVAANDWLCGKPQGTGTRFPKSHRNKGPVTLFEVVKHYAEILEGSFS